MTTTPSVVHEQPGVPSGVCTSVTAPSMTGRRVRQSSSDGAHDARSSVRTSALRYRQGFLDLLACIDAPFEVVGGKEAVTDRGERLLACCLLSGVVRVRQLPVGEAGGCGDLPVGFVVDRHALAV